MEALREADAEIPSPKPDLEKGTAQGPPQKSRAQLALAALTAFGGGSALALQVRACVMY
jgi:hypothetical protein